MKIKAPFIAVLLSLAVSLTVVGQDPIVLELPEEDGPPFGLPVDPDLYLIRPGDKLRITFVKSDLDPLTLQVDPEGLIVDSKIGVFNLSSKTLTQTRDMLTESLATLFNVANLSINITNSRLIPISVQGAIARPGTYNVYNSQRVSEVIAVAGGILPEGSTRSITLSGGVRDLHVDLDRAKFLSDIEADPAVYAGRVIHVPNKSLSTVQVVGEVLSQREIELLEGDDIPMLLRLAGGARRWADTSAIVIMDEAGKIVSSQLAGGEVIVVPPREENGDRTPIAVFGAVNNPGLYSFTSGMSLRDVINMAGGYLSDANAGNVTVFRKPRLGYDGRTTELRFPVSMLGKTAEERGTVMLKPEDSVYVPIKVGYVTVSGEVLNPGYYPYIEGQSALYYINTAGGFLRTADENQIAVFNPISRITTMIAPGVVVSDGSILTAQLREELK
ncbi:MAG: SLBB domain-containing protein [Candidatus Zixiibacteriota bacterium]